MLPQSAPLTLNLSEPLLPRSFIPTAQGNLAYFDNGRKNVPILVFFHGNSMSSDAFLHQVKGLGNDFRIIAMDSPGHGWSDNAKDPEAAYRFRDVAGLFKEALDALGVKKAVIAGWSKGGFEAIELVAHHPELFQGIAVIGAPPIELTYEGIHAGLKKCDVSEFVGQEAPLTRDQAITFMQGCDLPPEEAPTLLEAAMRTHGLARSLMVKSSEAGKGVNGLKTLQSTTIPLLLVNGEMDRTLSIEYIREVATTFPTLYKQVYLNAGHAPFWQVPEQFNQVLRDFIVN